MHRRTVALVLLAGLVALSGCAGLTDSAPTTAGNTGPTPAATQVQDRALDTLANASTYTYDLTLVQQIASQTTHIDTAAVVNEADRRMRQHTNTTVTLNGESHSGTRTLYVANGTMYVHAQGVWQTQPAPSGLWNQTALDRQRAFLASANVTVRNTTTVDGQAVYALAVHPDTASIASYMESRVRGDAQISVSNVTLTQYVAVDDHTLQRAVMSMTLSVNGRTLTQRLTLRVDDYGTATNVTVPDAATS